MAYSKLDYFFQEDNMIHNDYDDQHQPDSAASLNDELIERLSCYLYYLNFSINFFLYVLNRSRFREILFGFCKS